MIARTCENASFLVIKGQCCQLLFRVCVAKPKPQLACGHMPYTDGTLGIGTDSLHTHTNTYTQTQSLSLFLSFPRTALVWTRATISIHMVCVCVCVCVCACLTSLNSELNSTLTTGS